MQTDQIIFSASMLQDFVDCPRRFQLKYLLYQSWPSIPAEPILEIEQLMARGRQFHFLAQQFLSGLPAAAINSAITDETLRQWFDSFVTFAQAQTWQQTMPEVRFSAPLDQHKIVAIFDLVAWNNDGEFHIYDWKTSLHTPKESAMAQKMQTIIYPFVLYENIKKLFIAKELIQPAVLYIHYWYPEYPDKMVTFSYDSNQQKALKSKIQDILIEIDTRRAASDFPLTEEKNRCKYCQYRSFCDRGMVAGRSDQDSSEFLIDIMDIDFDALPDINLEV